MSCDEVEQMLRDCLEGSEEGWTVQAEQHSKLLVVELKKQCQVRWWPSGHQLAQMPHCHLQWASLATCAGGVFWC